MGKITSRKIGHYYVFLASPEDMNTERRAVRDFFTWYNRTIATLSNMHFEVIDWESYSTAGVGNPQPLIKEQILERFKGSLALWIGLMGQRFGSPTGAYGSGTEEEYEWALEQNRKTGFPEIKMFFRKGDGFSERTGDIAKIEIALEQFKKVQAFKKRISEGRGPHLYYREFAEGEFASVFRDDVLLWLSDPNRPWSATGEGGTRSEARNGHTEIEKACVYIREDNPDVAIALLNDLRKREWDTLSPRERFRVLANLGHAHRLKRDNGKAATFYIDSKKHQPNDENAQCLEALGEHLLGNSEAAYAAASDILTEHPRLTLALQLWLLNAPADQTLAELEARIPTDLTGHVEVAFALARRAMQEEQYTYAQQHARQVFKAAPDDPDAHCLLAQALLYEEGSKVRGTTRIEQVGVSEERLKEAISLLTGAIDKYNTSGARMDAATARVNRGLAYQLLGETELAMRDSATAFELAPDSPDARKQYLRLLHERGDHDHAIRLLRTLHRETSDPEACVSLAAALGQRGRSEDLTEGTRILTELLAPERDAPAEIAREAIFILAELHAAGKQWDALEALTDSAAAQCLDPESLFALRAVAKLRTGDNEGAISCATQALSLRSSSTPPATGRRLGHLFSLLKMPREARQSLGNVIEPNYVDDDVRVLLSSASEIGDDRFVLDFCSALREKGILDPFCVQLEANTLVSYHAEREAIAILNEILGADIKEFLAKQIRLNKSLMAQRINEHDSVERNLDALPAAEEADPFVGAKMVALLSASDQPERGADYAYALFRRHPDDANAHMAVIRSLKGGTGHEIELPNFDTVESGVAVVYQVEGESELKWCIIEDLPNPSRMLGEIAANDPLAQELRGKAVGEKFITNRGGIQEREAVIKGIVHKYIRRFQECLSGWEERFPRIPFLWRVERKEDEAGVPDISAILRSVDQRQEHVEAVEAVYRDGPLPLFTFAEQLGCTVFEAVGRLAANMGTTIRCCTGTASSIEAAIRDLSSADAVVIDSTAIATLLVLDEVELLQEIPIKCVVASGTMDDLRACLRDLEERSHDHHVMTKEDDRYVLASVSSQDIAPIRERVRGLIDAVNTTCIIESGLALAAIEPDQRRQLVDLFGHSGAESIALARGRKRVLWTDDLPLAAIASNGHGVSRVWTQVLTVWLEQRGNIGIRHVDEVALNLLVAGYSFTSLGSSAVLMAAEKASWEASAEPLKSVADHFASPAITARSTWLLAGQSLAVLWRQGAVVAGTGNVTIAILDAIKKRADGRGVIDGLRKSIDGFFGLDVVNARKAKKVIDEWHGGSSGGLILP